MKRMGIWTVAARTLLFEQLVARFGPHRDWQSYASPGRGFDDQFNKFLGTFAELVGATTAAAVKHQILFALPVKGRARWQRGHARNAILNIAAAFNAGFISHSDLPAALTAEGEAHSARAPMAEPNEKEYRHGTADSTAAETAAALR
jgi:nucleoid-associated protein YgaU